MKNRYNEHGFGAIEAILVVVIVVIIGGAGWYVLNANKNLDKTNKETVNLTSTPSKVKTIPSVTKNPGKTSTLKVSDFSLTFTVPDGWVLTEKNDSGKKSWSVAKPGIDFAINGSSYSFPVDGEVCQSTEDLLPIKVEVSRATADANFSILGYDDKNSYFLGIVPAMDTEYTATKTLDASLVANKDLIAGKTYYYCLTGTISVFWYDYDKDIGTHNTVTIDEIKNGKSITMTPNTVVPAEVLDILASMEWSK